MRSKTTPRFPALLIALLLAALILTACKGQPATPTPEPIVETPTATPAPAEIVLVDAQGSADASLVDVVNRFAGANALVFRQATTLSGIEISSGTKIVVFTSDPGNIVELSGAAPAVQFIVLGESAVTAGGNVSTIKVDAADRAFMAGYLTMLLAEDWRAAGLVTTDSPLGDSYADAFTNGAQYVCGKCNPYYAPVVAFPVVASKPTASDETTWANDAAALGADWLSAAFIDPAAANVPVANALSTYPLNFESVTFVGYAEVSTDSGLTWDVLIASDAVSSLEAMLPQLLAGQGGQQAAATVTLTQVNEEVVSPARQELFNETAARLAAGEIEPLTIP
jgi:hypothetical protein